MTGKGVSRWVHNYAGRAVYKRYSIARKAVRNMLQSKIPYHDKGQLESSAWCHHDGGLADFKNLEEEEVLIMCLARGRK